MQVAIRRSRLFLIVIHSLVASCLAAARGASDHVRRPDAWFKTAEAAEIAAHILSHQSALGGWPKNVDTAARPYAGDPRELKPTFDNGATTDELRFLARMFTATRDARYRTAFERGHRHVLDAQYANGGWPQHFPPGNQYHRHITFNDQTMVRLLEFLRETGTHDRYTFLAEERRQAARGAFDRGIQCILKCQIKVAGQLTAWCAQHDEVDFQPRPGRAYELATLSGSESVGIVRLLMSLDSPTPEIVRAVNAAVAWLESARCTGIRVTNVKDDRQPGGTDRIVQEDTGAPALWARFYEIGTNRPIFCDRDGVKKYRLAEIGHERRNGYAWYGSWAQQLLDVDYPDWKRRTGR